MPPKDEMRIARFRQGLGLDNLRHPPSQGATLAASATLHLIALALIALHGPGLSRRAEGFATRQGVTVTLVQGRASAAPSPATPASAAPPSMASLAGRIDPVARATPEASPEPRADADAAPGLDALFNISGKSQSTSLEAGDQRDPYALAAVAPSVARAVLAPTVEHLQRRIETCWKAATSAAPVTVTVALDADGRLTARPTVAGDTRKVAARGREAINATMNCAPYTGIPAGRYEITLR